MKEKRKKNSIYKIEKLKKKQKKNKTMRKEQKL